MKQFTIITVVLVLGILLLTGCQESDASQIRKARLVANENLQLKEVLKEKDQQIKELTAQIKALEAEKAKVVEQSGDTNIKTLKMLMESEKRAEELLIENRKLQEELDKIKSQ